jgi:hypothetical protein
VEIAAARLKHSAMRRLKARWQSPRRWRMSPATSRGPALPVGAAGSFDRSSRHDPRKEYQT